MEAGSCCLFTCDDGVGVLDVEWEEEVEGVRELVVEVGVVELVELTELWLEVDETDGVAELAADETGAEVGCGDWEVSEAWVAEAAEAAGVLEGTGEERAPVEGSAAAPTAPA